MKKVEIVQKAKLLLANTVIRRLLLLLAALLVLLLLFRLFLLVFPVSEFTLVGDSKYDLGEIVSASGIRNGHRLYYINKSRAEEQIKKQCPYIESVEIRTAFPCRVEFRVQEKAPGWYVRVGEDFYTMDRDLVVLEETNNEEQIKQQSYTELVLPSLQSVICTQRPQFGMGDQHLVSETLKIIFAMRDETMKQRMTRLDLSNRFEIKMVFDDSFEVYFGDMSDYRTKLQMIDSTIAQGVAKGAVGGTLYLTSSLNIDFKPIYSFDAQGE